MLELRDITIGEYLQIKNPAEYELISDVIKPQNKLCGNTWDTNKMTYNEFHTIISILKNPNLHDVKELFVYLYNIRGNICVSPDEMFYKESIFQFFRAKKFLEEFISSKLEYENKVLYSEPDGRLIEIGAYDMMKPYSLIMTKVDLGEQFGVEPEEVGNWKYSRVLNILIVNNLRRTIQKQYERNN